MKSITVEAKIENVDKVTEFVNEVLEEKECPLKVQMQLDVAIDEIFGNNSSKYLFEAIQTFSKNNQNNSYDKELFECIGNIGEFGLKKYTTNSIEVQNEAKKIHELIMQIRLYNEKGQINLLSSLSKLFGSKEYKGIIDNGKEKGISWFVSRVLEIYVENITGGNANGK